MKRSVSEWETSERAKREPERQTINKRKTKKNRPQRHADTWGRRISLITHCRRRRTLSANRRRRRRRIRRRLHSVFSLRYNEQDYYHRSPSERRKGGVGGCCRSDPSESAYGPFFYSFIPRARQRECVLYVCITRACVGPAPPPQRPRCFYTCPF